MFSRNPRSGIKAPLGALQVDLRLVCEVIIPFLGKNEKMDKILESLKIFLQLLRKRNIIVFDL